MGRNLAVTIIRKATPDDHPEPDDLYVVDLEELFQGCSGIFADSVDLLALAHWMDQCLASDRSTAIWDAVNS